VKIFIDYAGGRYSWRDNTYPMGLPADVSLVFFGLLLLESRLNRYIQKRLRNLDNQAWEGNENGQ
jgi:hypothetical protein